MQVLPYGERAVLLEIIEFTTTVVAYLRDPARVPAIPEDAVGARRLLRQYLSALV